MAGVKSEEEIRCIRASAKVNATVHEVLKRRLRPGVTSKELDRLAGKVMTYHHARSSLPDSFGYPGNICVSVNHQVGHGVPSSQKIRRGDVVKIDISVELDGFHSDCAHTYWIGSDDCISEEDIAAAGESKNPGGPARVPEEIRSLMLTTHQALVAGLVHMRSGNRLSDVSHEMHQVIREANLYPVKHAFGHGVGTMLHEPPQIAQFGPEGLGPRLESGMVMAIEPVVTVGEYGTFVQDDGWTEVTRDNSLGAHTEHTVLVTDKWPEVLTSRRPPSWWQRQLEEWIAMKVKETRRGGKPLQGDKPPRGSDNPQRGASQGGKLPQGFRFEPMEQGMEADLLRLAKQEMDPILLEAWGRPVDPREIFSAPATERTCILRADGSVAGFYIANMEPHCLYLNTIVIDHDCQGQGLGTAVMRRLEHTARQQQRPMLRLFVQSNNERAIQFYRKMGFKITGSPYLNTWSMEKQWA